MPETGVPASASLGGSWSPTTSYPSGIDSQSCVVSSGFVYCIGGDNPSGETNAAYYAQLSASGGVGAWFATTSYPIIFYYGSCVANSGFVYCIAGENGPSFTNAVYFASLSSNGIGPWSPTTQYPLALLAESCVVYSGFVYCVGGNPSSGLGTNAVFYAPLSSSGVGTWSSGTYPISIIAPSCVVNTGIAYCIGGRNATVGDTNVSYYAQLSSSGGVGSWSATTNYPTTIDGHRCVVSSNSVYCMDGTTSPSTTSATNAVYFASLSSSGIGSWSAGPNYPNSVVAPSCVQSSPFIDCIGGFSPTIFWTNAVYFVSVAADFMFTYLYCSSPSKAGNQTHCTATVTDAALTPTPLTGGTVTFTSSGPGSFSPSNICTLNITSTTAGACSVTFTLSNSTEVVWIITGTYAGDSTHQKSVGTWPIRIGQFGPSGGGGRRAV